jgi:hypothetical protein
LEEADKVKRQVPRWAVLGERKGRVEFKDKSAVASEMGVALWNLTSMRATTLIDLESYF